jgi:hypothetical protein
MDRRDRPQSNSCVNRNLLTFITRNWILYVSSRHIYAERERERERERKKNKSLPFWVNPTFKI